MKTKILFGLICFLEIFSANAQTITAPSGQNLTITNPINVTGTGNSVTIPADGCFKIGVTSVLKTIGETTIFLGNAGNATTKAINNIFLGSTAGKANTTGANNIFTGVGSGLTNTSGSRNLFSGYNAGNLNTTGSDNLFLGNAAGAINTTGAKNTYIGASSGGTAALTNATAIGADAQSTISNSVVLGNAATTITGQGLTAGKSGLRFANLTSASATTTGLSGNKVLSVNANGEVILVGLNFTVGTTSVGSPVTENWKESDGYLYNNSTNGVVIKGSGLDGNALIVKGGVLSKEVNVKVDGSDAWPDYVFKPKYNRMPLEEVEKFIAINGHLPNMPTATEMVAKGNNLGKTDIKLLEKIEELTLYVLELKKVNDAQAAALESLKQQVGKLRKK